jgi:hypothetical protein
VLLTWVSSGYVTAQVILPVVNDGGTWIELSSYQSDFTIYAPDGGITETTGFRAAAPRLLAPGERSYLVGEVFTNDHARSEFDRVEADGRYGEAREAPRLTVENTRVRKGGLDGVEATGEVHNPGTEDVDNADVVAIFFDADDQIIGYANGYVDNISPGGRRSFQIDSSFAEIRLGDIDRTEFYASSW